jgi:hypothetical protein
VEFGCGDGQQLALAAYPRYIGYDLSPTAVDICRRKFSADATKQFFVLDERRVGAEAELALSLDVVYGLLEDELYENYLLTIFSAATRFVVIYGNGCVRRYDATHIHIRLRDFNADIAQRESRWILVNAARNPYYSEIGTDPARSWSNFYVYAERPRYFHSYMWPSKAISQSRPAAFVDCVDAHNAVTFASTQATHCSSSQPIIQSSRPH